MREQLRGRAEFALALVLDLIGAGAALLVATRHWQTAHLPRTRPLADRTFGLTGRTLDNTPTALALVALAGVVAIVAVKGWFRRAVGVVLVVAGALTVWRSLALLDTVSVARALELAHPSGAVETSVGSARVTAASAWPVLSAMCGLVIASAGLLVAARGHRWATLSARYDAPAERPVDEQVARARRDASMWQSLDRGDDPTAVETGNAVEAGDADNPAGGGTASAG